MTSGTKKRRLSLSVKSSYVLCLLLPMLLLTGCPETRYTVDLTPNGNVIERKLVFYRMDGTSTNGVPNYRGFDPGELARLGRLYPPNSLVADNKADIYTLAGEFETSMPNDVGGSGSYTNISTSLGSAGCYIERFRGDDDLATSTEKRLHSADQLTDLVIGWSRMELRHERGYDQLRRFLDTDFRADVKNLSMYFWMLQTSMATRSSNPEEFAVRFGQYLIERGYLKVEDLPDLFHYWTWNDDRPIMKRIQRMVATKMGVPENAPIPHSLDFLSDADRMNKSWEKYLMTTDLYRAKLRHWQREKFVHEIGVAEHRVQGLYNPHSRTNTVPAAPKKPAPAEVEDEITEEMIPFKLFSTDDHVTVRLSLPAEPVHTNGKWDEKSKQVVWESDLEQSNEEWRVPAFCYAEWTVPNEAVQQKLFGKVTLSGDELCQYCLWRAALGKKEAAEWDALLAGLQPGDDFKVKLAAFRFSSDSPVKTKDNPQSLSDMGKDLLSNAVGKDSVAKK